MIGYKEIADACRYLDAISDGGTGFDDILAERGIDIQGLLDGAEQRALRIAMIWSGQDPRQLPRDRLSKVNLPEEAYGLIKPLQLAFVDGFIAGRDVRDPADRIQRFPERPTQTEETP